MRRNESCPKISVKTTQISKVVSLQAHRFCWPVLNTPSTLAWPCNIKISARKDKRQQICIQRQREPCDIVHKAVHCHGILKSRSLREISYHPKAHQTRRLSERSRLPTVHRGTNKSVYHIRYRHKLQVTEQNPSVHSPGQTKPPTNTSVAKPRISLHHVKTKKQTPSLQGKEGCGSNAEMVFPAPNQSQTLSKPSPHKSPSSLLIR